MSTFRFTNNITLFLRKRNFVTLASICHCQGLSAACNGCHFLDFDIPIIYHFKLGYLRFYWRYLNHFCVFRNM